MEYPSNSYIKKNKVDETEPKNIEQVVIGPVVRRKKPLGKRFKDTFVNADARSVWNTIAIDVLIPNVKDMITDAVSQGVERMLYGESTPRSRRGRTGPRPGYVNYNRYSSSSPPWREEERPKVRISQKARATHDFDEIILESRIEAANVIDGLEELIASYEVASVKDLYTLVGITPAFTDEKWGWNDIRSASITRVRSGYLLNLPNPIPLD